MARGLKRRPAEDTGPDVVVVVAAVVHEDAGVSAGVHGRSTAGHVGLKGVDGDDGRSDEVGWWFVGNEVGQRVTRDRCVRDTAWAPWLEPAERKCERRKRSRMHDVADGCMLLNARIATGLTAQSRIPAQEVRITGTVAAGGGALHELLPRVRR